MKVYIKYPGLDVQSVELPNDAPLQEGTTYNTEERSENNEFGDVARYFVSALQNLIEKDPFEKNWHPLNELLNGDIECLFGLHSDLR